MFGLNGWEIPAIVLLALLFFGGKKLPEFAKGFGKSIRTFKEEIQREDDDEDKTEEAGEVVKVKSKSKKVKKSAKKRS